MKRLLLLVLVALGCSSERGAPDASAPDDARAVYRSLADLGPPPADVTNQYADDPAAAELGKKFFFETRFSGPLLDDSNNGLGQSLGLPGETGKVACASCHIPDAGFLDDRSPRKQVSLGSGWTHRRAPSLLDVGHSRLLMWDGRRDAAYNQVFGPIESPVELNSSRLFVAQQVERLYREPYEAVFGAFPDLSVHATLAAADAGCSELPPSLTDTCDKPYDEAVTRVVVNLGKAISAYLRQLSCGPTRFDAWVGGEAEALSEAEQRGAALFVGKAGCVTCHSGPSFSDDRFHNVGLPPATVALFLYLADDPGAGEGLSAALADPLNVRGAYSDGDDGRLDFADKADTVAAYAGSFRTPKLRCVSLRPSFTHTGQLRSLEDVVAFFAAGGGDSGIGHSELSPVDLNDDEQADLVAFLRALEGPGPAQALIEPPALPPEP